MCSLALVATLFAAASAANLRNATVVVKQVSASDDLAEASKLQAKLEQVSAGIAKLLDPKGSLSKTRIAPEMATFLGELKKTLAETKVEKDTKKALKKLHDAQAGVQSLTKDITLQQVRIFKEDEDQEVSLLLGVLMTKKKEPMDKQLEVLTDAEFSKLAVVKAVLAAKDSKTPLFQQVAGWLDQHKNASAPPSQAPAASEIPDQLKKGKDGKPDVSPIVNALTARLHNLEDNEKHHASLHKEEMQDLDAAFKKENRTHRSHGAHRVELMKKKEARKYAKEAALGKHDIESLKEAIEAVQEGNMKKLQQAQTALATSMKAMEGQSGGFLYLIQLGHRASNMDCPYCAAQCFDKCHAAGKSYVECLTDCQDAGK